MPDEIQYTRQGRGWTVPQAIERTLSGLDYDRDEISTIEARLSDHGVMLGSLIGMLLDRGSLTIGDVDALVGYGFSRPGIGS